MASLLAVGAVLVGAGTTQAQGRMFGVKAGVTLASADVEDLSGTFDTDNRTGWGAGAFLTLGSGLLSIQPELNYVEIGFDAAGDEVELSYLVPTVLLRAGLPLAVVRPGLFGGVGMGFEAGCEIGGSDCEDSGFALETEATDLSGIFGADLDVLVGPSLSLRADVRYVIGFSDIHEASDVWTEIKNRAWAVSAGVAFRF